MEILKVDHSYQRQPNWAHVEAMKASYNPNAIGVFQVSDRLDDYFILDGQHRKLVIEAFDMAYGSVLCAIYEDLSLLQEEELFIYFNQARLPVDALHTFRNRVRAYDFDATIVERLLSTYRLKLVSPGTNLGVREISAINCLQTLAQADRLEPVLQVLDAAWGEERGAFKRFYLELVDRLLRTQDAQTLVTKLRQLTPLALDRAALAYQDRPGVQLRSYLRALEE